MRCYSWWVTQQTLKPQIAYAAAVARQIIEGVQAIEVVDPQIRNRFGGRESDIYGHPSAAVLVET